MKKILVMTPSFTGGSWIATEKIINVLSQSAEISVIGLGQVINKNKKYKFYSIPYPKYESWGKIHSKNPAFALIWNLPLIIYFCILFLFNRPNLVVSNGFSSSLIVSPLVKFFGSNFIVFYHGVTIGFVSKKTRKIVKSISKNVDLVVVNSEGSKKDISPLISTKKIVVNEHFADPIFFNIKKRKNKFFQIIYVGSLNKEKLYYPLIEIAKYFKENNELKFIFIGRGADQSEVEELSRKLKNVKYLGYIGDRKKLKRLYDESDALWSYADETYLSLPATEALASGLPLIIPKYPGMHQKSNSKITISKEIVPSEIGWLVDTNNFKSCLSLVQRIRKKSISDKMRKDCQDYAKKKYSPRNLDDTIARISTYL